MHTKTDSAIALVLGVVGGVLLWPITALMFTAWVIDTARSHPRELPACPRHESGHYTNSHPRNCHD